MFWTRKAKVAPTCGERYYLRGHEVDPWGLSPRYIVQVVDCRAGWVRYRMDGATRDDVAPLDKFNDLYEYQPTT